MQFDWLTFIAQIVNFLILIYLLKRFLYRPILNAMAARESKIAERLDAAERQSRRAAREIETYATKTRGLDAMREEIVADARTRADVERRAALAKARQNVEETRRAWVQAVEREKAQFLLDLQTQVIHGVCDISRRVLADLSDASLERQLVETFLHRLRSLPDAEKRQLRHSFTEHDAVSIIGCSFELGEDSRQMLREGVAEVVGEPVPLRFDLSIDLVFGIVLETSERRVEWSASGYLSELQERLSASLAVATEAAVPPRSEVSVQPARTT